MGMNKRVKKKWIAALRASEVNGRAVYQAKDRLREDIVHTLHIFI